MVGFKWTIEETVVLIFYTSRSVCQEAVKNLIYDKCHTERDLSSIRGKIIQVRTKERERSGKELYDGNTKKWDKQRVDEWLVLQLESHIFDSSIQELTAFNQAEIDTITKVRKPIFWIKFKADCCCKVSKNRAS